MIIAYTAKRNLISGHAAGTLYTIDIPMAVIDRSTAAAIDRQIPMDRSQGVTLVESLEDSWRFQTSVIEAATRDLMREFLGSTVGGETFTLDPYGVSGTADSPFTAEMVSSRWGESRIQTTNYFQISFEVRQIA